MRRFSLPESELKNGRGSAESPQAGTHASQHQTVGGLEEQGKRLALTQTRKSPAF
jgi:hypothetical protein